MDFELTDVIISSYQTGGSGDDMPIESMSLNFAKVAQKFYSQDDTGNLVASGEGKYDQQMATTK